MNNFDEYNLRLSLKLISRYCQSQDDCDECVLKTELEGDDVWDSTCPLACRPEQWTEEED